MSSTEYPYTPHGIFQRNSVAVLRRKKKKSKILKHVDVCIECYHYLVCRETIEMQTYACKWMGDTNIANHVFYCVRLTYAYLSHTHRIRTLNVHTNHHPSLKDTHNSSHSHAFMHRMCDTDTLTATETENGTRNRQYNNRAIERERKWKRKAE